MKKFIAALSLFALMNFGTCSAETVHAVGRGNTERNAIHDAMRTAIEQKLGANVQSKTRVRNSMVVSDKIAVDSAGLISRWEVVSRNVENGIFLVEIVAELDDEKISARLSELEKRALVDFNADNPRVAVIAFDSSGRRFFEVENEIITALKRQGFTRTVDLAQVNRAVRQRINSAAGDVNLCKTLANDFHADCLVVAEVKFAAQDEVSVSSRLIELNTGEIIFAGTSTGGGMFVDGGDALKLAGRRAANELSLAALKFAAKIEHHLTLLITPATFERLGGTLTTVRENIGNLSGVNDTFARKMTSSLELDVDFDGTAADFAQLLEAFAIRILELGASYIKI
ncbi:MAG: hypothetical protein J5497_07970 [Selenomonadaceae bacterium]|nr:hypothetical protein [Selenomonadaceae bacterium]